MNNMLLIIFIVPCILVAYDILVYAIKVYKIVHIGRWRTFPKWESAVYKTCCKWAQNAPSVRINDDAKYILWDIIIHKPSYTTVQYWQDAGLILGLYKYKSHYANKLINKNINPKTGDWAIDILQVDIGLLAYSILRASPNPNKIHIAMDKVYHYIISKLNNGTIPYRQEIPDIRFIDTLGLVCPFLMLYGSIYHNSAAIELAISQIDEYDRAFHPTCNLPCHAYDIKNNKPMGIYDWGRGVGWYILAIIECIDVCSITDSKQHTVALTDKAIRLANTLLPLQLDCGGYAEMMFNKKGFAESSASILIGLLMATCYKITKNKKYKESLNKIIDRLMLSTLRSGQIYYCQGDTKGIGYYSKDFTTMPYAQGMLLYLINEVKLVNAHN